VAAVHDGLNEKHAQEKGSPQASLFSDALQLASGGRLQVHHTLWIRNFNLVCLQGFQDGQMNVGLQIEQTTGRVFKPITDREFQSISAKG
jgi:hypothetical protein